MVTVASRAATITVGLERTSFERVSFERASRERLLLTWCRPWLRCLRGSGAIDGRTQLSGGRDEIGEDDDVVLVVAGPVVERPTAGDHPQPRVVDVSEHQLGGEPVLRELADPRDSEYRLAAVRPRDGDPVTWLHVAQSEEDPWPVHVDMAGDDRRTQLTGGRPTGVPTGGEAAWRDLQGSVRSQAEL